VRGLTTTNKKLWDNKKIINQAMLTEIPNIKEASPTLGELSKDSKKLSDSELDTLLDDFSEKWEKENEIETTSPLAELSKDCEILSDSELDTLLDDISRSLDYYHEGLIGNKEEGLRREAEVEEDLKKKYLESDGYEIVKEAYLRDSEGKIVKDPETGTARRIDFVVVKDGQVVDSIEVTSETADKREQTAKENRIREAGGNYIKTADGSLAKFPENIHTQIERRK
jgi:hypothetical protein